MNLNILVRGQSNAIMLMESNGWAGHAALQQEVARLLGFDGVKDTVSLVYERYDAATATAVGGTALVGDWLQARNGDWRQGWQVGSQEQALLNRIGSLPAGQRDDPTAVLWLHSEYDSANRSLSTEEWVSAVRYDAGLVRSALGLSAAEVPYLFVSAMPYWGDGEAHQAIRRGMEQLAEDPAFRARIAARMLDTDIANDDTDGNPGTVNYGGPHMDGGDALQTVLRAARAIAEQFAGYARPGAPAAGGLDDQGPEVVHAALVGSNRLRLDVQHDHASSFAGLDADAAAGVGWSVQGPGGTVHGIGVEILDADTLLVTFSGAVPADGLLFYGYGYGRLSGADGSGRGNAVYDNQGMPIWVDAEGLRIGGTPPVDPGPVDPEPPDTGKVLTGTAGTDVLRGAAAADSLSGLGGADSLFGGGAADTLRGGDGADLLRGDAGDDRLLGEGGNDRLLGCAGDDRLEGGAGNDTLRGGAGDDLIATGSGADRVLFGTGEGADRVTDFALGTDKLQLVGVTAAEVTAGLATQDGATGLLLRLPGGETLFLDGLGLATAKQLGLSGSFAAAPALPATTRTVSGTAGDDWLKGGSGADYLLGGEGSDDLQGLAGNDVLRGGRGHDGLTGGAGADTFCFARGDGADWIVDFARGTDLLRLEGIAPGAVSQHLESRWEYSGLAIDLGQGDSLYLQGVSAPLTAADMVFG